MMDNKMLDRLAGALMRAFFSRDVDLQVINICVTDQHDLVIAVLKEMREPTEAMIDGVNTELTWPNDMVWQEMIDRIIGDK